MSREAVTGVSASPGFFLSYVGYGGWWGSPDKVPATWRRPNGPILALCPNNGHKPIPDLHFVVQMALRNALKLVLGLRKQISTADESS